MAYSFDAAGEAGDGEGALCAEAVGDVVACFFVDRCSWLVNEGKHAVNAECGVGIPVFFVSCELDRVVGEGHVQESGAPGLEGGDEEGGAGFDIAVRVFNGLHNHEERSLFRLPWFPIGLRGVGVVAEGVSRLDGEGVQGFGEMVLAIDEFGEVKRTCPFEIVEIRVVVQSPVGTVEIVSEAILYAAALG